MSWVVRPAEREDVPGILALAEHASPRLTNLPPDQRRLDQRVQASRRAFDIEQGPDAQACHMLVMADAHTGTLLGTASLRVKAGEGEAYYTYRQEQLIHASHQLDVRVEVPILALTHELSSSSLLCALALSPRLDDTQRLKAQRLLRRARLMMISQWPERFADRLTMALPGVIDDAGHSPFWNSVGKHFFGRDFQDINFQAGLESKSFIAEVMPPYPLYLSLLSDAARESLAHAHRTHHKALSDWYQEGFEDSGHVDILDGGPVLSARPSAVSVIKNGTWLPVTIAHQTTPTHRLLLAGQDLARYRCSMLDVAMSPAGQVVLTPEQASLLGVTAGVAVRAVLEDGL
ncbi:arginine N-succinyltransferase [Larsenimonas rhizosphaerae]|uniref:Arginine N-succinyltransferase n=1 Tax=Larsenimonas rhizosphaerae TaxID=2944682 RepID=A0AA41ZDP7_9GAMM|nr:arginine N-succinyltransferase [Larsenimonas rhizosphaerae]MCX2522631.1 arginine N-succinyltransferase [Larsenimonas rhizosphaerae]